MIHHKFRRYLECIVVHTEANPHMNCALSCDQAGCIVFACVLYVGGCVWSRAMHIGCMYEANVDALTGEIGTPRAVRTTNKKKRREEKRTEENGPVPCFCFRFSVCARAV